MMKKGLPDSVFNKTIIINAKSSGVWDALTRLELMKKWMSETDIDIITNWEVGGPITFKANQNEMRFENKGVILQFDPCEIFRYSHLSSLSNLPDVTENYTVIEFRLAPKENQTTLTVTISNFPTEEIYKHFVFYWTVTLELLKTSIELYENKI